MFFAIIHQYCRKLDEDQQERIRVRNAVAASLKILNKLMEYPQFRLEAAECHIEGAMQDPAEPPSAADAEPPVAPDAEPRDSQNSHRKLQKLQKLQKLRRIPSGMIGEISQRKLRKLRLDRHHQNMLSQQNGETAQSILRKLRRLRLDRHHQNMLSQQNLFMHLPSGMIGMIGMKRSRFRKLSHHDLQTSTSGTKVNIQRITGATTPRPQEQQLIAETDESMPR